MRARRLPFVDLYETGDQVVVFVGHQVLVLSSVASAALLSVGEEWTDLELVARRVRDSVGPPPEARVEDAVRDLLMELAILGLVDMEGHRPQKGESGTND